MVSGKGREVEAGEATGANGRPGSLLKAGFGVAEVGLSAVELMLQVYLLELYIAAGLKPIWAGLALAVAALWDAVSDPWMGSISDRTGAASARGRRLPYVVAGAALSGLAFPMLFQPDLGGGQGALFAHLLFWYLFLNTALTLVGVPYLSLINDLAKRSEDRSGFFGWRLVFSGAGLILGLAAPSALTGWSETALAGEALVSNRAESALWIGLLGAAFVLVAVASVWRAAGATETGVYSGNGFKLRDSLRFALRSRSFRLVVAAFVFVSVGRAVNASLALLFYKGTLQLADSVVAMALIVLSLTIMVATPIWVLAARRFRKDRLCLAGLWALTALTATVYPLIPVGEVGWVYFIAVSGGAAAASIVLLESLFSDVVASDEARSGRAMTGAYYGLWRMSIKVARALGLAVSGILLAAIGYEEGAARQSVEVERAVAWAFGPGVAVSFAIGTLFLKRLEKGEAAKGIRELATERFKAKG